MSSTTPSKLRYPGPEQYLGSGCGTLSLRITNTLRDLLGGCRGSSVVSIPSLLRALLLSGLSPQSDPHCQNNYSVHLTTSSCSYSGSASSTSLSCGLLRGCCLLLLRSLFDDLACITCIYQRCCAGIFASCKYLLRDMLTRTLGSPLILLVAIFATKPFEMQTLSSSADRFEFPCPVLSLAYR